MKKDISKRIEYLLHLFNIIGFGVIAIMFMYHGNFTWCLLTLILVELKYGTYLRKYENN